MPFHLSKTLYTILIVLVALFLAPASQAYLSEDVTQAMDEANICNQVSQNYIYTECMQRNNNQIRKAILKKSQQRTKRFRASKKQVIVQNINKKMKSNLKQCLNEKTMFGDSMTGERRHAYCIYENILELLINVERNLEIYAR